MLPELPGRMPRSAPNWTPIGDLVLPAPPLCSISVRRAKLSICVCAKRRAASDCAVAIAVTSAFCAGSGRAVTVTPITAGVEVPKALVSV